MMDRLKRTAAHEAGHIVTAAVCGLSIDGATIDREVARSKKASDNVAGCVWGSPYSTCKPLEEFSDITLHELMKPPRANIEGQPLSAPTCILLYARTIEMFGGKEAERLLFDHPPVHFPSSSDMRSAGYLVGCITAAPKAALELLDRARMDAARILIARRHQVEVVAAALIEHKTLDGADIEAILAGRSLRRKRWDAKAESAALFMTMTGGGLKPLVV